MSRHTRNNASMSDVSEHVAALREDMTNFKQDVVALMQTMVQAGRHTGGEVAERAQRRAARSLKQMRLRMDQARDKGKEAIDTTQHTIEKHPFASVLTAASAGFLLGRFFRP